MGLKEKIFDNIVGGYIREQLENQKTKLQEEFDKEKVKILETFPTSSRKEDEGWTPITALPYNRDLQPLKQMRMQEIASLMYDRNGMAKRVIELTKDFIVGEGVQYSAVEPKVKVVMDEHWNDPVNNWDLKQEQKAKEIGLYGEQFYPTFVNGENGHTRLGYLDPYLVWKVETNPENIEEVTKVKIRSTLGEGTKSKEYQVVNINPETDLWEGNCFQFAINKVTSATRGRSDLLPHVDLMDVLEKFIFNRAERADLMSRFVWDITLKGMNQKEIDEYAKKQKLPKAAAMRFHNENAIWDTVSPKLEAADASNEIKTFRSYMAGGAGIPIHWIGGGEGLTRATALEMGTPAFKMLKSRQRYFKYMVEHIFRFVIDQKIKYKVLPKGINKKFSVNLPKLLAKDVVEMATALAGASTSLQIGVEQNWISNDTAGKTYAFLLSQLGADVSPKEKEKIKEELDEKKYSDYDQSILKEAIKTLKSKKEYHADRG